MAYAFNVQCSEAFKWLGENNRLSELADSEREVLYALLKVIALTRMKSGEEESENDKLERVAKVVKEAGTLAVALESEVFSGPYSDVLLPYAFNIRDIPARLAEFSNLLGEHLGQVGRPGHRERNLKSEYLVMASEFVRLKLGDYCDENLAELYQNVVKPPLKQELSGDAIRKRRMHLQTDVPVVYSSALAKATRASEFSKPHHPF